MVKISESEEIEKILETLPQELKEAFFSMETAEAIGDACKRYGITDNRVWQISDIVGQVLMGLLPPQDFQTIIQKEAGLPKVLAVAISQEINRFVFYPVKSSLEQFYKTEVASSEKPSEKPESEKAKIERKESKTSPSKDAYREAIE